MVERFGVKINFAHQTFKWSNEARANAAVFCVIVGFATFERPEKTLCVYDDVRAEPHVQTVKNVNAYLVDGPEIYVLPRQTPICDVPSIGIGNKPIDGGFYLFKDAEKEEFLRLEPGAAQYFKRWYGSDEFLNNRPRWCLWVGDAEPSRLRQLPEVMKRVEAVRRVREASSSPGTRKLAETPTRFHVENMPDSNYLVIPEVSSERRRYIPIGFFSPEILCSNLVRIVPNATLYHFGVLTSSMHMAWTRYVCGRLKSDYRYSKDIVYNNFPWPTADAETQAKIVDAAQGVLDARALFPNSSLADLYDPLATPPALVKAHEKLDRLVERAYRPKKFDSDAERVAFLFERYRELVDAEAVASENEKRKKRERLRS